MRIGHYREGVYGEHVARRFENLLGRSMWEFSSQAAEPRFLITADRILAGPSQRRPLPKTIFDATHRA
jgi:hypothetical protein